MPATRYEELPAPWVFPMIGLSVLATFAADCVAPLGYAVWIFYLAPVALCHYAVKPRVVLGIAALCSGLLLAGFFLSSTNLVAVPFAQFNRSLGFLVIWTIAALTYRVNVAREAVRKKDWMQRAVAELSLASQGRHSIEQLAESILGFLARYLDAHAAIAYLSDGQSLRSVASLAQPRDTVRSFKLGEGLVGEAARANEVREVRELPPNYLAVSSGLGESAPRALLLLPVSAGSEVVGVLELGFLHPVYPEDRELLAQLAEPIGVGLRVTDQQQRVRELLAETQAQAEELQTQQEELRVNNEELVQHSEMQRAQAARLEEQQAELEQSNNQLAEHTTQLMQQRDALAAAQSHLQQKAAELTAASQYKSEFLANMSHELRTPLNSALILSKLLADNTQGNLNQEQVQFARNIHTAGNDLLELINDILDLSKVEAGKMEVVVDYVVPRRLAATLKEMFEPVAAQKKLKFVVEVAEDAAPSLETDSQRLRQILRNLISNAIKFTEQGEVKLSVFRVGNEEIGFEVSDTGIGIAPEQHAVIFEAFQQANGTTSRRYGGTGLGLTISREFSRLLRGRLSLESELGKGTSFTLILPISFPNAEASETSIAAQLQPLAQSALAPRMSAAPRAKELRAAHVADDRAELDGSRRNVLIIEDDDLFATVLRDLAHELGFAALVTDSADQGLELAAQHHPVAILLDVKLVDHSGLTVLDRAKRTPALRHIPIHVMSAENHTQRALEMGAASYMLKPVLREQLIQALSGLDARFGARVRRVLVAEDNVIDRDSICSLLKTENVETVAVGSVAETFRALKENTYDCLVLDLSLSDGSGLELLEKMSEEQAYSFPPTVVYTGRVLSPAEELRLRNFSSAVIIKGARSPERLLDEVTLFLHQVEANLPAERRRMLEEVRSREALFEDRSVLIVEDDIRNIFALSSVLEPKRVKLRIARNGREAIEALESDPNVDLVLMDVMMPEMDGLTATREIRRRPKLANVPIIALTAKAMRDDMLACLEAGANDYISKPLDIEKLLSLMRVWMPRRSQIPLGLLERA